MTPEQEVLARADALMLNAPGRVSVRRISRIEEVRVLRAAHEALTEDDEAEVRRIRLLAMERLDGAVAAVASPMVEEKKGLVGLLLSRWRKAP